MSIVQFRISFWSVLLFAIATLAFGATSGQAQEATPSAVVEAPHPVHVHAGTCDALGDVVNPLNDITTYAITNSFSFGPAATPEADSTASPAAGVSVTQTTPVLFSFTHIDANVVDIVAGVFAINAHESAENIQNYIACGNVPQCTASACSAVTGVAIELAPQNESGYFGVARIDADPEGGSNVSVFLFHPAPPSSS